MNYCGMGKKHRPTKTKKRRARHNGGMGYTEIEAVCDYLKLKIRRGTGISKDMFFCEEEVL